MNGNDDGNADSVDGIPPPVLRADLASFTGAGYGTLRIPAGTHLEPGQTIAVTDDEADTLTARVLAVREGAADVRVRWNHNESAP